MCPILSSDLLKRTLRYINDNLDSKLTWRNIAATVKVNPFTFSRHFKLTTAMTPHEYVIRARVKRAVKLLVETHLSIIQIALEVGCSSQSHLTNVFRTYTGTTPYACRATARQTRRESILASSNFPRTLVGEMCERGYA